MLFITLSCSLFRAPAVIFYFTKKLTVITHHTCATRLMMIQMNKTSVSEFFFPVRNVFRKNVRMNVNREELFHANIFDNYLITGGGSMMCPQLLQVRRSSLP